MARDGDAQAATQGGGLGRERWGRPGEAEGKAAEEAGARQVARVDRRAALTAYLERAAAKGFSVETRSATQAVIARSRRGWRLLHVRPAERRVLSVDDAGHVTSRAAEPARW